MTIKKFTVEVTHTVEVLLDDSIINDDFNKEFSNCFWDVDCLDDHALYLAQIEARGNIGIDKFVEGYGHINKMNASVECIDQYEQVVIVEHIFNTYQEQQKGHDLKANVDDRTEQEKWHG